MTTANPYREAHEPPVSKYAIRSSASFAVVLGFMALLAPIAMVLGIGMLRASVISTGLLALLAGPALFIGFWSSRKTYLVRGGRGTIRLFADRVVVTDGDGEHTVAADGMRSVQIRHRTRVWIGFVPIGALEADRHVRLESPGRTFQLSRRLFEDAPAFESFCSDLDALSVGRLGQEPPAVEPDATDTPTEADPDEAYRRRLAYELDHIDDEDD